MKACNKLIKILKHVAEIWLSEVNVAKLMSVISWKCPLSFKKMTSKTVQQKTEIAFCLSKVTSIFELN